MHRNPNYGWENGSPITPVNDIPVIPINVLTVITYGEFDLLVQVFRRLVLRCIDASRAREFF